MLDLESEVAYVWQRNTVGCRLGSRKARTVPGTEKR